MTLHEKIIKILLEITSIVKDDKVSIGGDKSYLAVSHDAVTRLLHLPLARAGIVPEPTMESCDVLVIEGEKWDSYAKQTVKKTSYRCDVWVTLRLVNVEDKTDFIITKCFGMAMDSSDKAPGKAYSMALKTCYLKAFMLESLDKEEQRTYEKEDVGTRYFQGDSDDDYEPTYVPQDKLPTEPAIKNHHGPHLYGPNKKCKVMTKENKECGLTKP